MPNALPLYFQPRMLALLALGFSSGLPLALTASSLSVWLQESGVDMAAIGLFAAVATPYSLKFLWAPLVDGASFPVLGRLLGRRRGWLIGAQACLCLSILGLSIADPSVNPWFTALAALIVAFFSATQDIVADAYRVELLPQEKQGAAAGVFVVGYRFGMIASSAGALLLAEHLGWHTAYLMMAGLPVIGMLAALWAGEPKRAFEENAEIEGGDRLARLNAWMRTHIADPFKEFASRPQWVTLLLFVVLYKFADAFIGLMTNPFLREIGFSKEQIAYIVKLYGLIATLLGGLIGGVVVYRLGLMRSLFLGGILHGVTNLLFVWQARAGADLEVLAAVITLENFSGGVGTAAFVAFLSAQCNMRFTATQYALLSALSATARTWLSLPAGWVAKTMGWEMFFILSALLALPGLLLLYPLSRSMSKQKKQTAV